MFHALGGFVGEMFLLSVGIGMRANRRCFCGVVLVELCGGIYLPCDADWHANTQMFEIGYIAV